ncbi:MULTISPECIES: phosphopentomutase [Idiomarina]|jgi:phosphopentomutase|uniref:phosphopentomutase n=1 Tax=Idiomarina TaxID=135575 RepID=UPI0006C8CCC6|nr:MULTISPECIES: phosphopentomutase [Idiomarina]KPD20621.1 phosphopentomutase [Idiomarina abyssalis]MAO69445.1 phosphopentomutase [Idiomarina sp.]MBF80484.1 phosphopentomutase [Idiomarina sp.]SFT53153.1 phosphopentomutase [Idiomarina abyssalis]|tara:strand:- start:2408 stop:3604 length:1197 start_codon:yes stop_codon:yes gene_type:complete
MSRAIVVVLDSFGIGCAPDAEKFGDAGADTFGHIAEYRQKQGKPLHLPNLTRLGLFEAHKEATGFYARGHKPSALSGAYACAAEISSGKDTPSGHWELMGVPVHFEWGYFEDKENSFPAELLAQITEACELQGILGNCNASGTEIIKQLGEQHIRTGWPIFYTSADSVFQIAAHEEHFGLKRLYQVCEKVRELLEPYNIGRVIARPFVGENADTFERTANRKDYSVLPPKPTVLDKLQENAGEVIAIGKIADIFAGQGVTQSIKASGLEGLLTATLNAMETGPDNSLIFTNLVDFDTLYGHRRNIEGYASELEAFDKWLPVIESAMKPEDILVLTADHGCDPTWEGTDHTREYIPLLLSGHHVAAGNRGKRQSFADLGQTLCHLFDLPPMEEGQAIKL